MGLIQGMLIGLSIGILPTPLFFIYLHTTGQYGRRQAFTVALGVWVSDWMYILLAFWASSALQSVLEDPSARAWAGVGGGILLILFGGYLMRQRITQSKQEDLPHQWIGQFLKGFLVNGGNPAIALFWLGIIGAGELAGGDPFWQAIGAELTLMVTDSLKILGANYLSRYLQAHHLRRLQQIAGILLMLVGTTLLLGWF